MLRVQVGTQPDAEPLGGELFRDTSPRVGVRGCLSVLACRCSIEQTRRREVDLEVALTRGCISVLARCCSVERTGRAGIEALAALTKADLAVDVGHPEWCPRDGQGYLRGPPFPAGLRFGVGQTDA